VAQLQMFAVRLSQQERETIARIARREQVTLSDAVRGLIQQAAKTTERAPADKQGALVASRT
jgi:transposase-like protein